MRVYQDEKKAGIDLQLNKAGSSSVFVTAQVQVRDIDKYFDGMSVSELAKATNTVQTVEELLGKEQPDLALIVAILVSTGWNLNDDIFTPAEVWKAKSSPLHKPMNDNHNAEKILGHIIQSRALDKSGNDIEVAENESPPAEFDIEVAGVLYRAFPELSDRINEIIEKAKSGEMFVSMEAWFPDFGYGFIDPATGSTKLVERTEETAFLTKHLRIYGGCGEYRGHKVGRVLKDIIFGAQGFVDDPANPESVIKVAAKKAAASPIFVTAKLNELLEGGVKDVDEKQLKELQGQLKDAQACLKIKEDEVAKLQKMVKDFEDKNYNVQIATLAGQVEELNVSMSEASEKTRAVETEKAELQKQLEDAMDCAEKIQAELDEIREVETARDRLAKLSKVKKVEDEEATLAELRKMTDETFEVVLKYAGEAKSEDTVDDESKEKTDATDADENSKTTKEDEIEQAEAALNNVETDDSADFNVTEDAEKSEDAKWMSTAKALCGREDEKD